MSGERKRSDQLEALRSRWEEHGWEAADCAEAYGALLVTARLVGVYVDKALAELGTTGSRMTVLYVLDAAENGSLTIGQLARRSLAHPTSVTKLVDALAADGLVRKTVPEHDRRSVRVELTPKGSKLVERAAKLLGASRFGLGALDPAEVAALTQALDTVCTDILDA